MLSNLVSNAIAHAYERGDSGTITLTRCGERQRRRADRRDNGRGIAPENLGRIYDPFFTTQRGAGGSGLGLNIVFNIVTDTLKAASTASPNSAPAPCFTLTMPLQLPQ